MNFSITLFNIGLRIFDHKIHHMMLVQATSFPYTNYTRFLFKRQLRKEDNLEDATAITF